MRILIVILILIIQTNLLFSQTTNSNEKNNSSGIFPENYYDQFLVGISFGIGLLSGSADNISSPSFMNSNNYSSEYTGESNDLRIAKPFKPIADDYNSNRPAVNANILLELIYLTSYPIHLRAFSSMQYYSDFLYSTISRKYLNDAYIPESFNETSVIYNQEILLTTGAGLMLPVYGSFSNSTQNTGMVSSHSFVYVYTGISGAYPLISNSTQYLQITEKKDILRYINGTDTLRIINGKKLNTLNEFRSYLDIQLGYQSVYYNFGYGISLYSSIQLNSVLEDQIWKQYTLGLRFSIYYIL